MSSFIALQSLTMAAAPRVADRTSDLRSVIIHGIEDSSSSIHVDDAGVARAWAAAFTAAAEALDKIRAACTECGAFAPGHVMTCTRRTPMDDEAAPVDTAALDGAG